HGDAKTHELRRRGGARRRRRCSWLAATLCIRRVHDQERRQRDGCRYDIQRAIEWHAVLADRLLEKAVRNERDGEGERETQRVQRKSVQVTAFGRQEHVDRPMPQIDTVADRAEPSERPNG